MEWTNTQKQTFDTITRDESRIVIQCMMRTKISLYFRAEHWANHSLNISP
jgi:hypothetical protein